MLCLRPFGVFSSFKTFKSVALSQTDPSEITVKCPLSGLIKRFSPKLSLTMVSLTITSRFRTDKNKNECINRGKRLIDCHKRNNK